MPQYRPSKQSTEENDKFSTEANVYKKPRIH